MSFRWIDGMIHTGMVVGLELTSKSDARRICGHFITKGQEFVVREVEGTIEIFVPESYVLDRLYRKFPDIKWSILT